MNFLEQQLQNLENLYVKDCSDGDGQLMKNVNRLGKLQRLEYLYVPSSYLPQTFPQSLCSVSLVIHDWHCNLPRGLKELCGLKDFSLETFSRSWKIAMPLAELLPMDTLLNLRLGPRIYICKGVKVDWLDTQILGDMY